MNDTQAHKDPEVELEDKESETPVDGDIVEAFTLPDEEPEEGVELVDDEEEADAAGGDTDDVWNAI
jgi:hypothetical protein